MLLRRPSFHTRGALSPGVCVGLAALAFCSGAGGCLSGFVGWHRVLGCLTAASKRPIRNPFLSLSLVNTTVYSGLLPPGRDGAHTSIQTTHKTRP